MKNQIPPPHQTPCEFCNGTGEIPSFKGVSRFLLSREECPACCGSGLESSVLDDRDQKPAQEEKEEKD